jgi:NIMA (never in mitosis gene a)-related kinase
MDTLYETLRPSTKEDFEFLQKIGEGSFGKVYKARRKQDNLIYALKMINISKMDNEEIKNTLNEIRILCSITNPYIVAYKEAFLEAKEMVVVMEFANGGDLSNLIEQHQKKRYYLKEEIVWKFLCQILIGLDVLHESKVMHRDIKPANLFISKDLEMIKLGDLNVAKIAKNDLAKTQIGTPYYLAPEIWNNELYDYRCDIFSLGCVLYEMMSLELPFKGRNMQEIFHQITKGKFKELPINYSKNLRSTIYMMLEKNPKRRPKVKDLLNDSNIKFQMVKFGYKNDFEINKIMNTIVVPKNLALLKNNLPKNKKYKMRPSSVKKTDNFVIKSKIEQQNSVQELIKKIQENKLNNKENPLKQNPKLPPPIKLNKPNLPPLNPKYNQNNNTKNPRKDSRNSSKNRLPSPQVNRYREYLKELNNKIIKQKEERRSKEKINRVSSAEPKKKYSNYDDYIARKCKPGWWG